MAIIKVKSEIAVVCDNLKEANEHILQIISKARELADVKNDNVCLICPRLVDADDYNKFIKYGVDTVIVCQTKDDILLEEYTNLVEKVIKKRDIKAVLYPASRFGKGLSAILSIRFDAGLTADCIEIDYGKDDAMYFSRAAMNDSVIAKIKCINCDISMATVKKNVFKKKILNSHQGTIIIDDNENTLVEEPITIINKTQFEKEENIDLSTYQKVFCIGRGVKKLETYERIKRIADRCGAVVVGTRPSVEDNMIDKKYQVGQSGKSISPNIYVSFGVSGASQHIVGIKNANTIIAINNDKNAKIFDYSDYKIVEDLNLVLDELEKKYSKIILI